MDIPLCIPEIGKEEERAVLETLRSKWLVHGDKNEEFEKRAATFLGVKYAITVHSCASALFLALKGLGITGEVLVPSYTHAASANAIETAGATPVFVDIDPVTLNLDVDVLEKYVTKKTKAIMPVHVAGLPCDMGKLMRFAHRHTLHVIEDSAETFGGTYKGKQAGSFGVGCFSFFPTKNLTTGEGGMLTTNDAKLAHRVRTLMSHGMERDTRVRSKRNKEGQRVAVLPGYNMRMSNLLAALGVVQLRKLKQMNIQRRRHARYLSKQLAGLPLHTPVEPKGFRHVYQMYIIQVPKGRDALLTHLKAKGVGATVFSDPPVHMQPHYKKKYGRLYTGKLAETKMVAKTNIVLPMYPSLKKRELDYIVRQIQDFFNV